MTHSNYLIKLLRIENSLKHEKKISILSHSFTLSGIDLFFKNTKNSTKF